MVMHGPMTMPGMGVGCRNRDKMLAIPVALLLTLFLYSVSRRIIDKTTGPDPNAGPEPSRNAPNLAGTHEYYFTRR